MKRVRVLLVCEQAEGRDSNVASLHEAGYGEDEVVAFEPGKATDYLYRRGDFGEEPAPALIIIDIDHSTSEGRALLQSFLEQLTRHPHFHLIPALVLVRDVSPVDLRVWYSMGINACLDRPDSAERRTYSFRAVRRFWCDTVRLPRIVES